MSLSAAKSRVMQARTQIETNRMDDVDRTLDAAVGFLQSLTEAERAPVLAEIALIRAELASRMRPEDERSVRASQRELKLAREQIAAGQDLMIETTLMRAARYLENVPDQHKAELLAEIAALRAPPAAAPPPAPAAAAPKPAAAPAPQPPTPAQVPAAPAPVAAAPAPVPAVAVSGEAAIQAAVAAAESAIRQGERDVMNDRSFEFAKYAPKRAAASAALAALEQLQPGHPSVLALQGRLDATDRQADAIVIDAFKQSIESPQRAAARDLAQLEGARKQYGPKELDPNDTGARLLEWAGKVRGPVEAARGQLTSERGRAAVAEADAWLAANDQRVSELRLLAEAFALFRVEADVEQIGTIKILAALDSVEWNFSRDAERVVLAWDAVKKLIGAFENPRFAQIPEVQALLARYQQVSKRIATELRPLLAKLRVGPLIKTATYHLDLLKRDTDALDEQKVLQWRKSLREALVPLQRDWADDSDAQDFLAKCRRAFARSEEELGDQLVLREIQDAEVIVKPLVDRVERALALGSAGRVREHAPRLQARLRALEPFLSHQRAQLLDQRARAALARIEPVLGADVARAVAEAEEVPHFPIDIAADTKVQAVLAKLNSSFDRYLSEYVEGQEKFEASVDVIKGVAFHAAYKDIETRVNTMIRSVRGTEDVGDELRRLDRAHPAVAVVEAAVPKLVKRAQAWKARAAQKFDYAIAIGSARGFLDQAEAERQTASGGDAHDAVRCWPTALDRLRSADEAIASAASTLADDHDEADELAAQVAALRKEATERLSAVCLAEATRRAIANDNGTAQMFAEALQKALPDAPENAQIAAAIAGTADARQKAQSEIRARAELIGRRAEEAANAARPAFEAWAADKKPIVALAGTIVQNVDQYRGKWLEVHARSLGVFLYDEPSELNGDVYQFDYDPTVREHLSAGMKRLDALYAAMAEKVASNHGISGVGTYTQHSPRDARYLCEIVGIAQYTPKREIRDSFGRVVGSIDGAPYPVPRVVIRGVSTSYFVVVPGQPPSLDAMNEDGIVQ